VSKKKISIFFIPYISGESFLLMALFVILAPLMILGLVTQFLGMTIGPFLEPILKSYSSLISLPIIFFVKPESLATAFGTTTMSEVEIQAFFEEALKHTSKIDFLYMNLIFAGVMAILILLYSYKNGVKKGFLGWIGRYFLLNLLITVPLWGYIINKLPIVSKDIELSKVHYTEIYASMQGQVKIALAILLITVIIVTIIGHFVILFIGKNYVERKQYWEYRKKEKEARRLEKIEQKKNKKTEYY
jgi:antibiotic biosynthesis monooxygenase (ABM) superfamily enzyme